MSKSRPRTEADTLAIAKDWIRNAADERAVQAGARFDPERGIFVCDWMETYPRLYEGERAGEVFELMPFQREYLMLMFGWVVWSEEWGCWVRRFRHAAFWASKKNGKALALDTDVPTPNGFRRFGDLEIGDELFDETGEVCHVTGLTEIWHDRPCYEVVFSDGLRVIADQEHLWSVESFKNQYRKSILTTKQIADTVAVVNGRGETWAANHRIPIAASLQMTDAKQPIPPYTLGAWLGDGDSDTARITNADEEVLRSIESEGVGVGPPRGKRGKAMRYLLGSTGWKGRKNSLQAKLRSLGVLNKKHIPDAYLFGSERQRMELLKGLMDTDGTVTAQGQCVFTSTSPYLAGDVFSLVASLGYKPLKSMKIAKCQNGAKALCYNIQFWATADRPCFTIKRKLARLRPPKASRTRSMTRHIVSVNPVPSVPVRCISVDSPSQLFLITRGMIPTHNSPLAAAVNLYLLTADGEFGQKVYQAAANGQQAKIPQMHAVLMVRQSPELFEECKINGSTLQITHLPSNSYLTILSGDDKRGAKANEGLNGSVCFDEMHVVNREIYERVSRAGISRKEPLLLSYSTAGDDPSSIGYERAQYGRQVNSGERDDIHFLHVEYTIPDQVTESEIAADPEKYGRMANPAWGVLVKKTEFLSDWETSKGNQREMARCLQYRFNKWVGSTNRWLDVRGWERGKENYTLDDLRGRDCYAAIDLSRTRDLSSVVFTFPEDDEHVRLWPMFWMPETTAKERNHIFPFLSWAQAGYISLTPGDVVDYSRIKADVRKVVTDYDLRLIKWFFDPHYAEELTQQLADGESIGTSAVQGIGGERIQFPQTLMSFTGPSKEFERRVSAGCHAPGHTASGRSGAAARAWPGSRSRRPG